MASVSGTPRIVGLVTPESRSWFATVFRCPSDCCASFAPDRMLLESSMIFTFWLWSRASPSLLSSPDRSARLSREFIASNFSLEVKSLFALCCSVGVISTHFFRLNSSKSTSPSSERIATM